MVGIGRININGRTKFDVNELDFTRTVPNSTVPCSSKATSVLSVTANDGTSLLFVSKDGNSANFAIIRQLIWESTSSPGYSTQSHPDCNTILL